MGSIELSFGGDRADERPRSLTSAVQGRLRADILSTRLLPGQKLHIAGLAKTQPDTAHGAADWRGTAMPSIENRFFLQPTGSATIRTDQLICGDCSLDDRRRMPPKIAVTISRK